LTPRRWALLAFALTVLAAAPVVLVAGPAWAQTFSIDLGDGEGGLFTGRIIQLILMITVLSLAPSILVVVTSFTRIVVVLSLMRSALGVQQTPPNAVLISLALFLTAFIMAPTLEEAYDEGIVPLIDNEIDEAEAFSRVSAPFHTFMMRNVRDKDLALFLDMDGGEVEKREDTPFKVLVPAFMISELKRAFEIAFLVFIPFIIIDMTVASVLMSMGMMMLPPVIISLPFKLIFFVLLDGWYLIAGSLVQSYGG